MSICTICHEAPSIKTGKRKDGSVVALCADCVAEINRRQATKKARVSAPVNFVEQNIQNDVSGAEEEKEGDSWYKTLAYGLAALALAVFLYYELGLLESGEVNSVRVWWPLVFMYGFFGKWGVVTPVALAGLVISYIGIRQFGDRHNQKEMIA